MIGEGSCHCVALASVPFHSSLRPFLVTSSLHRAASSSSTPFPLRFTPFHWPAARNEMRHLKIENLAYYFSILF